MADVEPTVNIPSLLTLAVVSFFVIRWLLSSRTSAANSTLHDQLQQRGRRVDPAQVEQISQMFPQLNRRDIMWDLHRNGGSVAATTERILGGGGLETPPPSYQPQPPPPSGPQVTTAALSRTDIKPQADNLITRYNLESKLETATTATTSDSDSTIQKQESAWSQNRVERQRILQKRRDEMILAARRKMLERQQGATNP